MKIVMFIVLWIIACLLPIAICRAAGIADLRISQTKRIKITKADSNTWYKDNIGQTYSIIEDIGDKYIVRDEEYAKAVYKKDCKMI